MKYLISHHAAEDFVSRKIPFTVPANSTVVNQSVVIVVVDDDMLEPEMEGFRLLLVVDESRTPKTKVTFGSQLALFRINDQTDSEPYLTYFATALDNFLCYLSQIWFQLLHTDLSMRRSL